MKRLTAALGLILILCACGGGKSSESEDEPGVQVVEQTVIYEAKGGQHTWILSTPRAKFFEDTEEATLTAPQLSFRENDNSLSNIKGDMGAVSMKKQLITLEGNVFGKSLSQNAELRTTELFYDMQAKKIWTNKSVTIKRNGVTVKAKGMRANGDFSEIELNKQTTLLPENEKDL